jgi:hypothetical protein
VSALGLPGSRSRKKLPSRKSRGRISTVASSWIGRPSSLTVNVASAWSPSSSTEVTSPTLTPAIRTGELGVSVAAFSKTALTTCPSRANGKTFTIFA